MMGRFGAGRDRSARCREHPEEYRWPKTAQDVPDGRVLLRVRTVVRHVAERADLAVLLEPAAARGGAGLLDRGGVDRTASPVEATEVVMSVPVGMTVPAVRVRQEAADRGPESVAARMVVSAGSVPAARMVVVSAGSVPAARMVVSAGTVPVAGDQVVRVGVASTGTVGEAPVEVDRNAARTAVTSPHPRTSVTGRCTSAAVWSAASPPVVPATSSVDGSVRGATHLPKARSQSVVTSSKVDRMSTGRS